MSANIGSIKVLSHKERFRLERDIKSLKGVLRGDFVIPTNKRIREKVPIRRMGRYKQFMDNTVREDRKRIMAEIKKKESILRAGSPQFTNVQRGRLEAQAKKDRAWLRKNMGSQKMGQLKHKPGDPDFENAVQVAMFTQSPAYAKVANRYKNTMRIISDDPRDSNLENIRPKT